MSKRQLAMVMDLNKCIGCQTCTSACKTQWTNRNGREYMYWNNVETKPGDGYPRYYEASGGGFDENGQLNLPPDTHFCRIDVRRVAGEKHPANPKTLRAALADDVRRHRRQGLGVPRRTAPRP